MVVSRATLIRLIRALPDPPVGWVTDLEVDDFATKKASSYGTVLLDMQTHRTVGLVPGREAEVRDCPQSGGCGQAAGFCG